MSPQSPHIFQADEREIYIKFIFKINYFRLQLWITYFLLCFIFLCSFVILALILSHDIYCELCREKKQNWKICLDTYSLNMVYQSKGWSQFLLPKYINRMNVVAIFMPQQCSLNIQSFFCTKHSDEIKQELSEIQWIQIEWERLNLNIQLTRIFHNDAWSWVKIIILCLVNCFG